MPHSSVREDNTLTIVLIFVRGQVVDILSGIHIMTVQATVAKTRQICLHAIILVENSIHGPYLQNKHHFMIVENPSCAA